MARPYFLAVLAASLLLMAFPPIHISWMAWVGFVTLLFALQRATSLRQSMRIGFLFGVVFMGGFHAWIWELSQFGPIWGIGILWLLYTLYLAVFYGFFGGLAYFFKSQRGSLYILGISASFVLMEALRQTGPIGSPGGMLGYSHADRLIASLASWTGVSGVSFAIALFASTLYERSRKDKTGTWPLFSIGTLGLLVFGSLITTPPISTGTVRASSIQGAHSQHIKLNRNSTHEIQNFYLTQTADAIREGATLILWPETITPRLNAQDPHFVRKLQNLLTPQTILLWGTPVWENGKFYNSIVMTTSQNGMTERYHKHRLVPFGEYWPLKTWFQKLGLSNLIPGAEYSPGPAAGPIFSNHFSSAICLEALYGTHFRAQVLAGSQGFAVNGNHGWYGHSSAAAKHLEILRFRAIEYQRSIVFASTSGISALILPNGKLLAMATPQKECRLIGLLPLHKEQTPYARYGEWFLGILIAICISVFMVSKKPYPSQN